MHWNEHVTDVDIMDVVYYPPSPVSHFSPPCVFGLYILLLINMIALLHYGYAGV